HQDLEAAIHAAVIEIEPEAPDFERFATAFVLARVDAGVELPEHLVVAGEERTVEDFGIAQIDFRFKASRCDDDALVSRRKFGKGYVLFDGTTRKGRHFGHTGEAGRFRIEA